jgi:adenosylcobinamide-GDP ribazoletransferase
MNSFWAALSFLTIFPVTREISESDLKQAPSMFPWVGILLGSCTWAMVPALNFLAPHLQAILICLVMVSLSGAFHLDGLADTFDGFLSSRPRDRILEIMKDSHNGCMGVTAIVFVILIKSAALSHILSHPTIGSSAIFLAPFLGRCSLLHMMFVLPYARISGLGTTFWNRDRKNTLISLSLSLLICLVALSWLGLLLWSIVLMIQWLFFKWSMKKIGGGTGDVLGAVCEITEAFTLLFFCAL